MKCVIKRRQSKSQKTWFLYCSWKLLQCTKMSCFLESTEKVIQLCSLSHENNICNKNICTGFKIKSVINLINKKVAFYLIWNIRRHLDLFEKCSSPKHVTCFLVYDHRLPNEYPYFITWFRLSQNNNIYLTFSIYSITNSQNFIPTTTFLKLRYESVVSLQLEMPICF